MRDKLIGLAVAMLGIINAVPSPAAVHPMAVALDCIDDDLTGSGREAEDNAAKLPQRRHALRLRVRSARDRAALLRVIDELPSLVRECLPDCGEDPADAVLAIRLIEALYDRRPLTIDTLAARLALPSETVLRKLERFEASQLVRLAPEATPHGDSRVMPTPAFRAGADAVLDRLCYALTRVLNGP